MSQQSFSTAGAIYPAEAPPARLADLAFVSQEPAVADFARAGIEALWLPLAWDPRHIYPRPEPERYPSSYVGEAWGKTCSGYNQTRVVLHVLGAGRCLLTDDCAGLTRLFREDEEVAVYARRRTSLGECRRRGLL